MSNIDKQALREAAGKNVKYAQMFIHPRDVLALLDELEAFQSFRTAYMEWSDKTEWVQSDNRFEVINPWGKHRADVLKLYIDHLESNLEAAEKRIAELEARQGKPVMFIDGDISSADAEKLAAVIREFNEETETPAARMARIIRENPHPTNMCDMPAAGIGVKGE